MDNFWSNKNVLITGIYGFIGSNLTKSLVSLGANVIGITRTTHTNSLLHYEGLNNKVKLVSTDLNDLPALIGLIGENRINHIFHLAAKYSPEKKRHEYAQKATYFYDRCLNDLLSYKTAYLTRPLVILCVYGYVHDYFLKNGYGMESISRCYDFGSPQTFLPQRLRFKKHSLEKLKNTLRIVNQMIREKISLKINRH